MFGVRAYIDAAMFLYQRRRRIHDAVHQPMPAVWCIVESY